MDLLKQCQKWFEQDEAQKVIDALEVLLCAERFSGESRLDG